MERTIESLSGNLCNSVTRHGKNSVKIGQLIVRIIRVYLDIDKKRRHCAYNTADFIFRKLLSKGDIYRIALSRYLSRSYILTTFV